ncbi:hypothetical protein B0H34DRAFT_434552 [Crassisporium funariophilum]|nr:hypothetical protein B0H34DRAFT_434552 [Crassisporium funariophilum]
MPRSNYMPAYIRETRVAPAVQPTTPAWLAVPEHCMLQWPLIEFAARKREGEPPVYFDAGFDPRQDKYAPRAKRGAYSTPLTREECTMCISSSAYIPEIIIISRKLEMWPVHIRGNRNLRVIDIFRQIYDTYSRQLTQEELMRWGPEYIARCERAFKQRCEDGPALTVHAERHGMLRIDLLRGRRIFKGLVPIRGKPMHYELLFED